MPDTKMSSGISKYFYTDAAKKRLMDEGLKATNAKLTRSQRRKFKRELAKYMLKNKREL
ncbi:hypothetical protein ACJDU8_01070 [Clostridium sp. WILCCON 0269]|uniref:Uncharacterized protein n=1 Tax=Candidatus Clostridium eludens TaxID=3381663 RepID=A0ABW8SEJ6_9CLOT